MKIIGIFTRLAIRDKKMMYLKLIPHAWKLIELRMKKNQKFRIILMTTKAKKSYHKFKFKKNEK